MKENVKEQRIKKDFCKMKAVKETDISLVLGIVALLCGVDVFPQPFTTLKDHSCLLHLPI